MCGALKRRVADVNAHRTPRTTHFIRLFTNQNSIQSGCKCSGRTSLSGYHFIYIISSVICCFSWSARWGSMLAESDKMALPNAPYKCIKMRKNRIRLKSAEPPAKGANFKYFSGLAVVWVHTHVTRCHGPSLFILSRTVEFRTIVQMIEMCYCWCLCFGLSCAAPAE